MSEIALIEQVTPEQLTDVLQEAGYRVERSEQNGAVQLLSASQGIGYALRLGNPTGTPGHYFDYSFSCALRLQGDLPAGLVEQWNASRRFCRLWQQGEFLLMEMDCAVTGGVTRQFLRHSCELWDRLLQEFVAYLRDYSRQAAERRDVAQEA